jgi:hypothetical protein
MWAFLSRLGNKLYINTGCEFARISATGRRVICVEEVIGMNNSKCNGGLQGRPLALFYLIVVVVLAAFGVGLVDGPLYVTGNLHDFFIPLNAGYYWLNSVEFYSPLGFVYSMLNALSLESIGEGDLNKVVQLSSALWLVVFFFSTILFVFLSRFSGYKLSSVDVLLWGVALTFVVSFRDMGEWDHKALTFYGAYNNHLWSLVLVSMLMFCVVVRHAKQLYLWAVLGAWLIFAFWLSFFYKLNFSVSFLVLLLAMYVLCDRAHRLNYLVFVGLLMVLTVVGIRSMSDGFFDLYFSSLAEAFKAKSETGKAVSWAPMFLFLVAYFILSRRLSVAGQYHVRNDVVSATVLLSVIPAYGGDFARPGLVYVFALLAAACLLDLKNRKYFTWVAVAFCVSLIALNVGSNLYLAKLKLSHEDRFQRYDFFGNKKFSVLIKKKSRNVSIDKLVDSVGEPYSDMFFVRMSCGMYGAEHLGLPYSNAEYIEAVNEAGKWIHDNGLTNQRTLFLEFSNPYHILLGATVSQKVLHWIHYGTTMSVEGMKRALEDVFEASDVVIVPAYGVDGAEQISLNRIFYERLQTKSDFSLEGRVGHMLLFVREQSSGGQRSYYGCENE